MSDSRIVIKRKVINKVKIEVLPSKKVNSAKVKGGELFADPYCNIFLVGKKKQGKTTVDYNIISHAFW